MQPQDEIRTMLAVKPGSKRDVVIETLRALENDNGVITARAVLDAARPKDSPLHKYFEWEDSKAAEKYRIEQAGCLIRMVKVVVHTENYRIANVPYYVHTPDFGYRRIDELRTERDAALLSLHREVEYALKCMKRAETIAIGLSLEREFQQVLHGLDNLIVRVRRAGK